MLLYKQFSQCFSLIFLVPRRHIKLLILRFWDRDYIPVLSTFVAKFSYISIFLQGSVFNSSEFLNVLRNQPHQCVLSWES